MYPICIYNDNTFICNVHNNTYRKGYLFQCSQTVNLFPIIDHIIIAIKFVKIT